jgi:hypothetical protein
MSEQTQRWLHRFCKWRRPYLCQSGSGQMVLVLFRWFRAPRFFSGIADDGILTERPVPARWYDNGLVMFTLYVGSPDFFIARPITAMYGENAYAVLDLSNYVVAVKKGQALVLSRFSCEHRLGLRARLSKFVSF